MEVYHKIQDDNYFIITFLLQSFLEEFTPDKYYTEDLRNKDFALLVDYASHEIGEQQFHSLLGYEYDTQIQTQ
jgi:hypothetical protein